VEEVTEKGEEEMNHSCLGLDKYITSENKALGKPPHYFRPFLKDAPDESGNMVLTVLYMNDKDHVSLGWGIRLLYCPACGEEIAKKK